MRSVNQDSWRYCFPQYYQIKFKDIQNIHIYAGSSYTPYPIALHEPTTNSAYLNDYCLSPFDCVGLMDVVAENGGWGTGTLSALGYLMGVGGIDVVRII